jgi:single-strand DNA-binding protein
MNQTAMVMMAGHVVAEPRLGHTKSGEPFARIRVGVTPRRPDRLTGEWHDIASSYFTVNCWRRMATNASASLRKGDPVIVWGKLKSRSWVDSSGQRHQVIDIEADTICHDASMGWTHFLRGRNPGHGADETARRELAAAEEADARGDGSAPGDFAGQGVAGDDFAADGDPEYGDAGYGDAGDIDGAGGSAGDGGTVGMDAIDLDAGGMAAGPDEGSFRDGNPFRDNAVQAGWPGESEVSAATAADPVAALVTEAASL